MKKINFDKEDLLLVIASRMDSLSGQNYQALDAWAGILKNKLELIQKEWSKSKKPASIRNIVKIIYHSLDEGIQIVRLHKEIEKNRIAQIRIVKKF